MSRHRKVPRQKAAGLKMERFPLPCDDTNAANKKFRAGSSYQKLPRRLFITLDWGGLFNFGAVLWSVNIHLW
jgi:hypothetical protein